jgi:hypothetical protein
VLARRGPGEGAREGWGCAPLEIFKDAPLCVPMSTTHSICNDMSMSGQGEGVQWACALLTRALAQDCHHLCAPTAIKDQYGNHHSQGAPSCASGRSPTACAACLRTSATAYSS